MKKLEVNFSTVILLVAGGGIILSALFFSQLDPESLTAFLMLAGVGIIFKILKS